MQHEITFPGILHGGDYNPEQWPEQIWDEDVRLMHAANVNVATLPVFGWVSLQPSEDVFTFEWLDTIIEKLHAGGIKVCMATATASVPAWVDQKYPDILRVDPTGHRVKHGGRHTFCPNSPNFHRLSTTLARKLAERYGKHPALVVWHINNEYGNAYGNICYCEQCAAAFRTWLQNRYGSLDEVNARWYMSFWGHTYTDWSQIEPPTQDGERSMQALMIDYDRFQSESLLNCYKAERDVIREYSPNLPITTNLMGSFKPLDYHKWAAEMDIVSWDSYPARGASPASMAFQHSLMRGLKENQSWMLMEQTPSQQNWAAYNSLKHPGVMRLWSYQAMANGADTVMYFQWRRGRGGCEKFHGAVVEHAAREDARVFQEVAALGRELKSLGTKTLNGRVQADAAVLFDWENWWGVEYSVGPSTALKYVPQVQHYYNALHANGIVTDLLSPEADLSKYKLIVAPVLYMIKPGIAEKLIAFVESGGTLITTYFSGVVDETDLVFEGGYPGPLRKLLGIWVEELDALSPQESNAVLFTAADLRDRTVPCGMLCERIHAEGVTVLGTYTESFYAGEPAATVNTYGAGKAYYLGTQLAPEGLEEFIGGICARIGVVPPFGSKPPSGVEVTPRIGPDGTTLIFVLNHNSESVALPTPAGRYRDLLTGTVSGGSLELAAYGVAILEG